MSSFSIDFTPVFNTGMGFALALIVSLTGILGLIVGFYLFRFLWTLILSVFAHLGSMFGRA